MASLKADISGGALSDPFAPEDQSNGGGLFSLLKKIFSSYFFSPTISSILDLSQEETRRQVELLKGDTSAPASETASVESRENESKVHYFLFARFFLFFHICDPASPPPPSSS